MHFAGTLDNEKLKPFLHQKADLQDAIEQQKSTVEALKKARKETLHHIDVHDLPDSTKRKPIYCRIWKSKH